MLVTRCARGCWWGLWCFAVLLMPVRESLQERLLSQLHQQNEMLATIARGGEGAQPKPGMDSNNMFGDLISTGSLTDDQDSGSWAGDHSGSPRTDALPKTLQAHVRSQSRSC